ncbi:hypothetical protein L533_4705 [Bordetella bronchiseptica OSU553]|nr:hypothetical protein L533_4705 [Bordetella bronchiseptica OSU553]
MRTRAPVVPAPFTARPSGGETDFCGAASTRTSAAQGRHLDKTPSTGRMTTCNIRRVLLISQNP